MGHIGKTNAKGAYFIVRYTYITNNIGIVVFTVFKVPPPALLQTILTAKVTIKEVKINIVRGWGEGLHSEKDALLTRSFNTCQKTFLAMTVCPLTREVSFICRMMRSIEMKQTMRNKME